MSNHGSENSQSIETGHDNPKISQPALRALHAAGFTRLDQLAAVTERDLLKLHGMGPQALGILREALNARGQSFADSR